ncbi:MAG: hypothetical protein RL425_1043 [Pseudomonadota bacterium]|jgi:uncharacterized protein YggE
MYHRFFIGLSATLLAFASPALATDPAAVAVEGTRLELQARGAEQVVPDLLMLRASVVTQATDAAAAMHENAVRMARVQVALRQAGLKDREIRTDAVSLTPQYRYAPNEAPIVTGYQATNSLSIRVRDLSRAGSLIDALVGQGVNQIDGPIFLVEDQTAAENRARISALQTLQARAALYARSSGMTVHRIVSIREAGDVAAPMPYLMARSNASDASPARTEIMAGEQEIAVTVTAVFELRPSQ